MPCFQSILYPQPIKNKALAYFKTVDQKSIQFEEIIKWVTMDWEEEDNNRWALTKKLCFLALSVNPCLGWIVSVQKNLIYNLALDPAGGQEARNFFNIFSGHPGCLLHTRTHLKFFYKLKNSSDCSSISNFCGPPHRINFLGLLIWIVLKVSVSPSLYQPYTNNILSKTVW